MSRNSRQTLEQNGRPCAYCQCEMVLGHPELRPTRDHMIPRKELRKLAKNERRRASVVVWCCHFCNAVKDSLTVEEWAAYRLRTPDWRGLTLRAAVYRRLRLFRLGKAPAEPTDADRLRALIAQRGIE